MFVCLYLLCCTSFFHLCISNRLWAHLCLLEERKRGLSIKELLWSTLEHLQVVWSFQELRRGGQIVIELFCITLKHLHVVEVSFGLEEVET